MCSKMTVTHYLQNKFVNLTNGTKQITSFVNSQKINQPFRDNDIETLLTYHPNEEKIKDIEYLIIRIRPPFNGRALYVKNKCEETENDVSYKYCLRALFNKYSKAENNVNRIMRTFRDVIANTKKKQFFLNLKSNTCQQCETTIFLQKTPEDFPNLHIDHYKYTFQQILDEFVFETNIDLTSIKVFENNNNEFEFEDKIFQKKWIDYHDKRAIFKALCKKCNLTNGTYGYKKHRKKYQTFERSTNVPVVN